MKWTTQHSDFKKMILVLICISTGCTDKPEIGTQDLPNSHHLIQDKLYAQLESKMLAHPAMHALIDKIQAQYSDDMYLKDTKKLHQWLCLNSKYVSQEKSLEIEQIQANILKKVSDEKDLGIWINQECTQIRDEIEHNVGLVYLYDTQEKLFNMLNDEQKEAWKQESIETSLICAYHFSSSPSLSSNIDIHTITFALPGFSKISTLHIGLDEQQNIFEPLDFNFETGLFYSFKGNHSKWLIEGKAGDDVPVSCQINFDICEERRLEAKSERLITYGEYLGLKERNDVPLARIKKSDDYVIRDSCKNYKIYATDF
jgi:hypothetical protein